MKVYLRNLQRPLEIQQTKVCSIKDVCKGVPLPNNRDNFYKGSSACIACTAKKSKAKWDAKKNNQFI